MDLQKIKENKSIILDLLSAFCKEKLDEEYFELAERMTFKLGREAKVPFINGQPASWAAAIIHAIGAINFLFDKSFEPYLSTEDLCNYFGTNKSATSDKSKRIREKLNINLWDSEFSTKKMIDSYPFSKLVKVDGLIVSLDTLPQQYQQMVMQARAEGKDLSYTTI
jgi:hypothetical protein